MKKVYKIFVLSFVFSLSAGLMVFNMALGQSTGEISINADGSVTPSTSLITSSGNVYSFTGNVKGCIDVYANNIIIDGNGYTLQGKATFGFWLKGVNNVTIRNLTVEGFMDAIYSVSSSYNYIYDNNLTSNNLCGIEFYGGSNYNQIYRNNITANWYGITLSNSAPFNPPNSNWPGSNHNQIYQNNIQSNTNGIFISNSSYNEIHSNNIIDNGYCGICLSSSYSNEFYLNNLVGNSANAKVGGAISYFSASGIGGPGINIWDNGSVGNYWSDYNGTDTNHDGIGDNPYIIGTNNTDNYPLMAEPFNTFISPKITVLSPLEMTYNESSVSVVFALDKLANWTGYSLDGHENVTVNGNFTLMGLSNGVRNVTVYANDTFGNSGASQTISFTVAKPEAFPNVSVVVVAGTSAVVVVASLLVYFKKRKH